MYAVIRLRGIIGKSKRVNDTLRMIGLKKTHSIIIIDKDKLPIIKSKSVANYVTWGEVSTANLKKFEKPATLNSPRKGFRATKMIYPKGDLGYRGDKINELIERMCKWD